MMLAVALTGTHVEFRVLEPAVWANSYSDWFCSRPSGMTYPDAHPHAQRACQELMLAAVNSELTGGAGPIDAASPSDVEALQRQLNAVESLYRMYKVGSHACMRAHVACAAACTVLLTPTPSCACKQVEYYAVLEEMRMAAFQLKAQGHPAVLDCPAPGGDAMEVDASPHTSDSSLQATTGTRVHVCTTIRGLVAARQRVEQAVTDGAGPSAGAGANPASATDVSGVGTSPKAPALATGPALAGTESPVTPADAQRPAAASHSHAHQDMSSSPPGVSLNVWAAPGAAVGGANTPQSLRYPSGALQESSQQQEGRGQGTLSVSGAAGSADGPATEGATAMAAEPTPAAQSHMVAASAYGEEVLGYGSDADPVCYSDVEDAVLAPAAPRAPQGVDEAAAAAWWARFAANSSQVGCVPTVAGVQTQVPFL